MTEKIYALHTKLNFGKFKGETIESLILNEIEYLQYLIEENEILLSNDAFDFYNKHLF